MVARFIQSPFQERQQALLTRTPVYLLCLWRLAGFHVANDTDD